MKTDGLTLGERIDHLAKKHGMTNEELARRLFITTPTLCKYKKDPKYMPYGVIKAMCKMFNCRVEYLLDGTNTEESYKEAIKLIRSALHV